MTEKLEIGFRLKDDEFRGHYATKTLIKKNAHLCHLKRTKLRISETLCYVMLLYKRIFMN